MTIMSDLHQSVLLEATLRELQPQVGESYLDLTAGMGGHARAVLAQTTNYANSLLVDRDDFALNQLADLRAQGVTTWKSDFAAATDRLVTDQRQFDLILLDLGVSSPQLDQGERGFSFNKTAKLDMRMDQTAELDAYQIVNYYSIGQIVQILTDYAEIKPKLAMRVAQVIDTARRQQAIETTTELAELICQTLPSKLKYGKTHPATKYFQAIRMAVNDELGQLRAALERLPQLLTPGGRVAIISFHSLEDRLVKTFFKTQTQRGLLAELELVTPKPILGSVEDVSNPRSRSAVLRVAMKKQKQKGGYNAKTNQSSKQITSNPRHRTRSLS